MVTKAPKSLPLCLPRNLTARPAPESTACVNSLGGRRGCYIWETVKNKLKSTTASCGGVSTGLRSQLRRGECQGLQMGISREQAGLGFHSASFSPSVPRKEPVRQSVLGTRSSFLCVYLTLAPSSLSHFFALYPVISGKFPEASGASSLLMSSHDQIQKGPCFSLALPR